MYLNIENNMSDKTHHKIVAQYAQLRTDYNKLLGLNTSTKKCENDIFSRLSVNEITIEDVRMDIEMLTIDIANFKQLPEQSNKKKLKR